MSKKIQVVAFGEILFDLIDSVPHLGGAPLNLTVQLMRLGVDSRMISAVGNDSLGNAALTRLNEWGMDTSLIARSSYPTGQVIVTLDSAKVPSYEFLENCAYDHIESDYFGTPDLFCYGTLAQRAEESRRTLHDLWNRLNCTCFYDVNLRQHYYDPKRIQESMSRADIVKINEEEFSILCHMFDVSESPEALAGKFCLDALILTKGADGSYVYSEGNLIFSPAVPVKVVSTVGAGDAFSAAFLYHYLQGEDIRICAAAGNALAAETAGREGAI